MKTITFECETITPMFLSGADGKTPELRPPSIKGALRFWWRAMNGDKDLKTLKKEEVEIFGGGGEKAKRSNLIIRVIPLQVNTYSFEKIESSKSVTSNNRPMPAIKYIGYGLYDFINNSKNKKYIEGNWSIEFKYNPIYENDLKNVLSVINLFGCLGSKARNGFGSIQLTRKGDGFDLLSENEFFKLITNTTIRDFPSFVKNEYKKIKITIDKNTAIEALEEIAVKYQKAKSNTKPNKFIATDKIKELKFERYPKKYFFYVKKDISGKYYAQAIYLPVKINSYMENQNYISQNNNFQNSLK